MLVKNLMLAEANEIALFTILTQSTPLQQKARELMGVIPNI